MAEGTLADYMRELSPDFPCRSFPSVRPFHDILAGVEFIHAHGILHLDLKPANVLCFVDDRLPVEPVRRFKLCDFDSSEVYTSNEIRFCGAGTPPFYPLAELGSRIDGRGPASVVERAGFLRCRAAQVHRWTSSPSAS